MNWPRLNRGAPGRARSGRLSITTDIAAGRFLEGPDVPRRTLPFVLAAVLPFTLVPFAGASLLDPEVLVAAALVPPILAAGLFAPWSRLPAWPQTLVPLSYFLIVYLLRGASDHEINPFNPLVAIPIAWFCLYGTRAQLAFGVAGLGLTIALPAVLVGEPEYGSDQYALAVVGMLVSYVLGRRVQLFVAEMRRLAAESQAILGGVHEAFISVDAEGLITQWNPEAERIFGWTRDEVVGRSLIDLAAPPEEREALRKTIPRFIERGEAPLIGGRTEATAVRRDGTVFPIEMSVSSQRADGEWAFNVLVHDISERKRQESALLEAEERFRRAFEDIRVGMAITSVDGVFMRVNKALADMLGLTVRELTGKRFAEITHPDDVHDDIEALVEIVEGERYQYRTEKRYLHANGQTVWIALNVSPIHDDEGVVVHMISQMEDITERKETEAKLTHQALHDPLTGLPNRVLFADRVRMAGARRDTGNLAVIYLDLDTFKPINDSLGHASGDRLLIEVARRLERVLRDGDTLARLGGDEFAILCDGVEDTEAKLVAERVIEAFEAPFVIEDREVQQAASIGVAVHPRGGRPVDPEQILHDADQAMYNAKAAGKSRYSMFEGWMDVHAGSGTGGLERQLREGIGRNELIVHYQPEINLSTGAVTGAEALVRWQHPDRGLLEPAMFMFVAEATGLITRIDDYVLWQACHQAARWRASGEVGDDFTVSVNLSENRLADRALSGKVAQAVADSNLPPSGLCLEVAERSLMDRRGDALTAIPDIEELGVRLLIDDFGVAVSSFSAIKRLPRLSAIKIDSSFVAGLGRSREDSAGVAAIIGLAHGLKLTATAEGVETAEQTAELRELGCDRGLGYYFARPQAPASFSGLLDSARYGELLA